MKDDYSVEMFKDKMVCSGVFTNGADVKIFISFLEAALTLMPSETAHNIERESRDE